MRKRGDGDIYAVFMSVQPQHKVQRMTGCNDVHGHD